MHADPETNGRVAALGERLYGERPQVTKFYSENNYVCRLDFPTIGPPKVLKLAVSEHLYGSVRQEADAIRRLETAGLEVAPVEFSQNDVANAHEPFFVMPLIAADNLGNGCRARLPWAMECCGRAGRFLARLHALPAETVAGFQNQHYPPARSVNWGHWTVEEAWAAANPELRDRLMAARDRLNERLREPPPHVVHDSFIAGQVITDGGQEFAVTDWETIRLGYGERDVACFLASLKTWMRGTDEQARAFLDGYALGAGLTDAEHQRVTDWQLHYLMVWAAFYLRSGRADEGAQVLAIALTD